MPDPVPARPLEGRCERCGRPEPPGRVYPWEDPSEHAADNRRIAESIVEALGGEWGEHGVNWLRGALYRRGYVIVPEALLTFLYRGRPAGGSDDRAADA